MGSLIVQTGGEGPGATLDPGPAAIETAVARWFGEPERPLLGWLSTPRDGVSSAGVLVLPPVGYSYWSSHRTLRVLAERLAAAGHTVLRFDYEGTGDSSGDQWHGDRVASWRASASAAADELRSLGCRRLVLVGVRLGGTLALLDAPALDADAVVAWEPVAAGRRYARELRMLALAVPETEARCAPGTLTAGGVVFTPQTLEDVGKLALADIDRAPAARVLVVGAEPDGELIERLTALGCAAEQRIADGEQALEVPAEGATVPAAVVDAICEWVGAHSGTPEGPRPDGAGGAQIVHNGQPLTEEVVALGASRLVAIVTARAGLPAETQTVVLLNPGSESHVGPGRAWVEYARELADAGYRAVRVDWRGWGESPDDGLAPGRPYDAHGVDDTIEIVRALRARGHEHLVLVGLCAGAWVAMRAVLLETVDGVIAINPQLYWKPGDPVFARNAESILQRTNARRREALGARYGVWSALDMLGQRTWPARWLDDLVAAGTPIAILFAGCDEGLKFLEARVSRRLASATRSGVVHVADIPGIDHAMHRAWARGAVVAAIRSELEALSSASAANAG
jgi:alpha-beta hydrolase superfamily lysophospholipase